VGGGSSQRAERGWNPPPAPAYRDWASSRVAWHVHAPVSDLTQMRTERSPPQLASMSPLWCQLTCHTRSEWPVRAAVSTKVIYTKKGGQGSVTCEDQGFRPNLNSLAK
jgi:hypothetical protein